MISDTLFRVSFSDHVLNQDFFQLQCTPRDRGKSITLDGVPGQLALD